MHLVSYKSNIFITFHVYYYKKLQINYNTSVEVLIQRHTESLDHFTKKLDDSILGWLKCKK
jgi:hypothetical protein